MIITFNNKLVGWVFDKVMRRKMTTISFHYERSYKDDEQIYESFARQCFAEMRDLIDKMEVETNG